MGDIVRDIQSEKIRRRKLISGNNKVCIALECNYAFSLLQYFPSSLSPLFSSLSLIQTGAGDGCANGSQAEIKSHLVTKFSKKRALGTIS